MKVQHLISTISRETEGGTGQGERRRGILPAVFPLIAEWSERGTVRGEPVSKRGKGWG